MLQKAKNSISQILAKQVFLLVKLLFKICLVIGKLENINVYDENMKKNKLNIDFLKMHVLIEIIDKNRRKMCYHKILLPLNDVIEAITQSKKHSDENNKDLDTFVQLSNDGLLYDDQLKKIISKKVNHSEKGDISFVSINEYASAVALRGSGSGKIAVVYADGDVVMGKNEKESIRSEEHTSELQSH